MPATKGPKGPFPPGSDPEQYDKLRRRLLWKLPCGLYLLGSRSGDRRNLMTHSFASQVATDPKLLAVSVWNEAITAELISTGGVFSLSLLKREDKAVVRGFTKPVEYDPSSKALGGMEVKEAVTGAPVPLSAAAWFDCEVRHELPTGDHTLFIGEVVDCGSSSENEDWEVLRMEDTRMNYGG